MAHIQIIGDDLMFDGLKVGKLTKTYPSLDAAVRKHLTHHLCNHDVKGWRP